MNRIAQYFPAVLAAVALTITLAGTAASAAPAVSEMVEGKNYSRLKIAQPVETGNKIEIIEFFSYGCPHCNDLEPYLQTWFKTMPADVQYRRVPVMFQDRWKPLGRIYYTLDALGDEGKLSPAVFQAIHGSGLPLYDDKAFFDWAAGKGLDRAKVAETFTSFGVDSKLKRAMALAQTYNIQSVPTMIVDGKFVTSSDRVGGHAGIPAALDALIVKARAERPKA